MQAIRKIYHVEFPLKQIKNFEGVFNNCSNNHLKQPVGTFLGHIYFDFVSISF